MLGNCCVIGGAETRPGEGEWNDTDETGQAVANNGTSEASEVQG